MVETEGFSRLKKKKPNKFKTTYAFTAEPSSDCFVAVGKVACCENSHSFVLCTPFLSKNLYKITYFWFETEP